MRTLFFQKDLGKWADRGVGCAEGPRGAVNHTEAHATHRGEQISQDGEQENMSYQSSDNREAECVFAIEKKKKKEKSPSLCKTILLEENASKFLKIS